MNDAASSGKSALTTWTLVALGICALLFFLRFGYDYAGSDQDEWLPQILHHLDPELFATDWFVISQQGFGIRSATIWLCTLVARVTPLWLAVLVIQIGSFVLLFVSISRITLYLTGRRLAALVSPIVALVLTPQWTLGSNDLVHSMLVPSTLAWGFGLAALLPALKGRALAPGILLAMAVAFQPLVGLQLGFVYIVALALRRSHTDGVPFRRVLQMATVFIVLSGPIVIALLVAQPVADSAGDQAWMRTVLAGFRAPHHYDFRSFSVESYVRFGGLVGAMLLLLFLPATRNIFKERGQLTTLVAVSCSLLAVGFVASPLDVVFQAQLFKQSIFLKVLAAASICAALASILGYRRTDRDEAVPRRLAGMAAVTTLLLWVAVVFGLLTGVDLLRERVRPLARSSSPAASVEHWARVNSSKKAVFAVPPSNDRFRTNARRSIVVNFKSVPFDRLGLRQWSERLQDIAGPITPAKDVSITLSRLDAAYESKTAQDLTRLAEKYGFSHAVRTSTVEDHPRLRSVFQSAPYVVYEILDASETNE